MPLRFSNLRLRVEEPEAALPHHLVRLLRLPPDAICHWRILRKSLDARDKAALHFVYTVELTLGEEEQRVVELAGRSMHPPAQVEWYAEPPFELPQPGSQPLTHRPVVI